MNRAESSQPESHFCIGFRLANIRPRTVVCSASESATFIFSARLIARVKIFEFLHRCDLLWVVPVLSTHTYAHTHTHKHTCLNTQTHMQTQATQPHLFFSLKIFSECVSEWHCKYTVLLRLCNSHPHHSPLHTSITQTHTFGSQLHIIRM